MPTTLIMRRSLRLWSGLGGAGVTALALVIGLVATAGSTDGAAELAGGPAAASRSLSEADASQAPADELGLGGVLSPVTVPPTTSPARTPATTAPPPPVAPPSIPPPTAVTSTTVAPTTTTTTNPCFVDPRPAAVTVVNDFPHAVLVGLNGWAAVLGSGERREIQVVPGACADDAAVRVMHLPGMPCESNDQRARLFQPGRWYVVTVVADPAGCMGLPLPILRITPA